MQSKNIDVDYIKNQAISSIEKNLKNLDQDLAQFVACSALRMKTENILSTYSLCSLITKTRKTDKGLSLKQSAIKSEDENTIWIMVINGMLPEIVYQ